MNSILIVSEGEFKAKYLKNRPNLLSNCTACDHPQPRYKLHEDHSNTFSQYKYQGYKQCLPGCVVIRNLTSDNITKITYKTNQREKPHPIWLISDTKCVAFDARNCTTTPRTTTPPVNTNQSLNCLSKGELSDYFNSQGKL